MKLSAIILTLGLVTQMASASVITLEKGTRSIQGVNIAKSATLTMGNTPSTKLDLVGAGLRTKHVVITDVKVYVTQIFLDNVGKFVRTNEGAVASLEGMQAGAIRLTFLRDVDAQTVQTSFKEAFKKNAVNMESAGVQNFLSAVSDGADAQKGRSMNISLSKSADGTTSVVYENTEGDETTITGDANLFKAIFSIWLGEPADSGLESLRSVLIKGENL